jgi:endoglucanase
MMLARLFAGLLMAMCALGAAPAAQSALAAGTTPGLKVQDRSHDNDNPDEQLYGDFQILNTGTTAVPLSSVTMRYWFTDSTPTDPLVSNCDYAQVSCSNITTRFVTLATPVAGKANTYIEYSFAAAAGSIAAGGNGGEIQARVHHAAYENFNTANCYSFVSDPSFIFKDSQTVTLYVNGVLVWGVEPS